MAADILPASAKPPLSAAPASRPCPRCGSILPIDAGFRPWCQQCDWNVDLSPYPIDNSLFGRLYRALDQRSGARLFNQMLGRVPRPAVLTPSRVAALVIAAFINTTTLALVGFGVWLAFFAFPGKLGFGLLLSVPVFGLAWLLLPRPPGYLLPRSSFPRLYGLVDQLCRALKCPPVASLYYQLENNAAFGQSGWRRRPYLCLGLPALSTLSPRELMAVITHELAHGAHGDPTRGLFLGTALYTLTAWYELCGAVLHRRGGASLAVPLLFLSGGLLLPFVALIRLLAFVLGQLIWYDRLRAEYHADYLAARLAGAPAHLAALDKLQLSELYYNRLKFAYIDRHGRATFFKDLRRSADQVPQREFERLRRAEQLFSNNHGSTHPTHVNRRQFAASLPPAAPLFTLAPSDQDLLEQELAEFLVSVQDHIFSLDELRFRELFRLSW